MGGEGNEQETEGRAPSSKGQASTLKHLQLLRRDLLKLLFLSGLNPPKRGAPGVPGVAGVEGADATSSDSITNSPAQSSQAKIKENYNRSKWGQIFELSHIHTVLCP